MIHALILPAHDSHCEIQEYLNEFDQPTQHCDDDDGCASHFMYHIAYLLPTHLTLQKKVEIHLTPKTKFSIFKSNLISDFFKPPIL